VRVIILHNVKKNSIVFFKTLPNFTPERKKKRLKNKSSELFRAFFDPFNSIILSSTFCKFHIFERTHIENPLETCILSSVGYNQETETLDILHKTKPGLEILETCFFKHALFLKNVYNNMYHVLLPFQK